MSAREIITGYPSTMGDDVQLNTSTLIRHAARTHPEREIVHRDASGAWQRTDFGKTFERITRGARALTDLGVSPADRVGVLDWNSLRFFELYWSIPATGAVMVQINLRLGAEDMGYVLEDSGSSFVCVDESLLPIAESIAPQATGVKTWVILSDRPMAEIETSLPNAVHYEDLLAAAEPEFDYPEIDERSAYAACYTTGTTGRPKGVFYSHRAIVLHSYAISTAIGMTMADCTFLITPMFHCQGWGMPQAAVLNATKIVLPGRYTAEDTEMLSRALIDEDVTVANGAPAIFQPILRYIEGLEEKPDLSNLRMLSGASEPPLTMMKGYQDLTGAEVIHGYGATETTPLVTVNRYKESVKQTMGEHELLELKRKQGLPIANVEFRLLDGIGNDVPFDGVSQGEICLRGPWITQSYHGMPPEELEGRFVDGFWRSGDVGTIDENGYLKVTDRIKDVIKSGGEWISSIDMENLLLSHPAIANAAVVGLEHPKWQERPFVIVELEDGAELTLESLHEHLSSAFAKWQMPEAFEVVDEVPRTSVGKFDKKQIRAQYADYYRG